MEQGNLKNIIRNEYGAVTLTPKVFETIAGITISENKLVEFPSPIPFVKNLECKIKGDTLFLIMDLKVKKGYSVDETILNIQKKLYNTILEMTDIKIQKIEVNIVGFII